MKRFFLFGVIVFFVLVLCSCKGDIGPAGAAGKDGTDGYDGTDGLTGGFCDDFPGRLRTVFCL